MIKEEDRKKIIDILSKRVGKFECPICHNDHFSIVDGYTNHVLSDDYHEIALSGRILPYIMLVCDNCGFISHHALGTFGLISKPDENASNAGDKVENNNP